MDDHDKGPTAIEKHEPPRAMSPVVAMGMRMLEHSPSPETLRELLKVQREWEENEARKAYAVALVGLKRDLPTTINRDKLVHFETTRGVTTYRHATLANVLDQVRDALVQHGFALDWHPATREGRVHVTCRLTHAAGHFEETTLDAPLDNSGGKNAVQSVGSTITYLQRYSALALLGIATADQDDTDDQAAGDNEPKQPNAKKVDVNRNLSAVGKLKRLGKSVEEACKHVDGRTVEEWTEADLKTLEAWAKAPAPTPTEGAA